MEIELGNTKINVKNATNKTLEKVILEIIKTKHPKREEILNFYFKKNKMKPHKKLNNELSFIECSIKYDDHDLLCKYVKNLTLCAPSFNIINLCVEHNKIELLNKYIKEKRISLEQCVNENTPLITAIKKKHIDCFDILLNNGCKICQPNSKGSSPICNLFSDILIEKNNNSMTEENKIIYKRFIDKLLPKKIITDYDILTDELKIAIDKNKKFDYNTFNKLKDDFKLLVNKNKMFESDLFEKITNDTNKKNNQLTELEKFYINKYNIIFSNCETSKLIKMANHGLDDIVSLILSKRPYMLFLNYDDFTVIVHLFNTKNENVINNILTNYLHIVLYDNELLNYLAYSDRMDYVKIFLNKYPECAKQIDDSGRTLIDSIIISSDIEEIKKIDYIDYFIGLGVDVNNINQNNLSTLDIAVQHSSRLVIEYLIKYVNSELKNRDMLYNACCFEKFEILKLLVENDFFIELSEINDVPTCIYPALKLSNYNIVKYILEEPKFKIVDLHKKNLYDFARMYKSGKNILCLLNEEYKTNHLNDLEDENSDKGIKYEVVRLNGMFDNFIDNYEENHYDIISYIKMITMIILKIINNDDNVIFKRHFFEQEEKFVRTNNLSKSESEITKYIMVLLTYENINVLTSADIYELFTRAIESNINYGIISTYKDILIKNKPQFEHFSKILTDLLQMFIDDEDNDDSDFEDNYCPCCGNFSQDENKENDNYEEILEDIGLLDNDDKNNKITKKNSKSKSNKKNKSSHTIQNINVNNENIGLTEISSDTSDELIEFEQKQTKNKNTQSQNTIKYITMTLSYEVIAGLLSRLTYPFVMDNYDVLKNLLSHKIMYYEDEHKFNFIENNELVAMVYKSGRDEIPKWIETYGYNIGIDTKLDANHMFSFGIDILLFELWNTKNNNIKCKYRLINAEKHATCIYIYGKVLLNDKWEKGYFEYFLNDKNVLFHRLFRPSQTYFHNQ
jgi:hypothetical protein